MKTPEQLRLEAKLKLWETPGFSQFLSDLQDYKGVEADIQVAAGAVRSQYIQQLIGLQEKGKLKQTKIPFNDKPSKI